MNRDVEQWDVSNRAVTSMDGASGANHIMPCTTEIAALMLDFGMTQEEAMNHPRIDASVDGRSEHAQATG